MKSRHLQSSEIEVQKAEFLVDITVNSYDVSPLIEDHESFQKVAGSSPWGRLIRLFKRPNRKFFYRQEELGYQANRDIQATFGFGR